MQSAPTTTPAEAMTGIDNQVVLALSKLGKLAAAVNHPEGESSEFTRALDMLRTLARKEAIPIAIVGGLAAIRHGYERLTNDLDVVIGRQHLDTIIRVAPGYGIKIVWQDAHGWHKLQYASVRIEVVPEGGKPRKDSPTTIPSPLALGVPDGLAYANLEGWVETKLGAGRRQDQADVVQVVKKATSESLERVRAHLDTVHPSYRRLFEELVRAAEEEKEQEAERGGPR